MVGSRAHAGERARARTQGDDDSAPPGERGACAGGDINARNLNSVAFGPAHPAARRPRPAPVVRDPRGQRKKHGRRGGDGGGEEDGVEVIDLDESRDK